MSRCTLTYFAGFLLMLLGGLGVGLAADTNPPVAAASRADDTNSQETLRNYLQLQEQIHETQLAIERTRKEMDLAAAQNAKVLGDRLLALEEALSIQRSRELEAIQGSNRVMLYVAGAFAATGLLAVVLMVYFQWRAVSRLAEISAVLPASRALLPAAPVAALGSGESAVISAPPPADRSNARLLGALERLERRILELEHTAQPVLKAASTAEGPPPPNGNGESAAGEPGADALPEADRVASLLGKGQALLNEEQAEQALACFDEVLKLQPAQPEALVKKGAALERLRKLNEAIECYDRAIAADGSFTIAYLHKGGLFNRMERFSEALECYEQALRTQEKRSEV